MNTVVHFFNLVRSQRSRSSSSTRLNLKLEWKMNVKRGLAFGLLLCFRSSHFHLILSIRPSILCGLFLVYHVTVLFQFTCLRVSEWKFTWDACFCSLFCCWRGMCTVIIMKMVITTSLRFSSQSLLRGKCEPGKVRHHKCWWHFCCRLPDWLVSLSVSQLSTLLCNTLDHWLWRWMQKGHFQAMEMAGLLLPTLCCFVSISFALSACLCLLDRIAADRLELCWWWSGICFCFCFRRCRWLLLSITSAAFCLCLCREWCAEAPRFDRFSEGDSFTFYYVAD